MTSQLPKICKYIFLSFENVALKSEILSSKLSLVPIWTVLVSLRESLDNTQKICIQKNKCIYTYLNLFLKIKTLIFNYVNIKEKGGRMLLNIRPIVRFPRRTSQGSSALTQAMRSCNSMSTWVVKKQCNIVAHVIIVFVALPGHSTTRPTPTPTTNGYQWRGSRW